MRLIPLLVVTLMLLRPAFSLSADHAGSNGAERKKSPDSLRVAALLKEATEIVLKQKQAQRDWYHGLLWEIGKVQIQAGDLEAARECFSKTNYGSEHFFLTDIAEVVARRGHLKQALEMLPPVTTNGCNGSKKDWRDDRLRLAYLDSRLSRGDLQQARQILEDFKAAASRSASFQKLAVASMKQDDKAEAKSHFQSAVAAAESIKDEFDRARALCRIADSQIELADSDAAAATIQRLLRQADSFNEGSAKEAAIREAAVLAAKTGDRTNAQRLFERALKRLIEIESPSRLLEEKKGYYLKRIAMAQASVGYFHDARRTASLIDQSSDDSPSYMDAKSAFCEISLAQSRAGFMNGALETAQEIDHFQYEATAFEEIVSAQIQRGDRNAALAAAEQIGISIEKAIAQLQIAIACEKAGDQAAAKEIAAGIRLEQHEENRSIYQAEPVMFDYSNPRTWADLYEHPRTSVFSRRGAELASAAMTLSLMLDLQHKKPFEELFCDIRRPDVIRALARAHAKTRDADQAFEWARQIGSDAIVPPHDDDDYADEQWQARIALNKRVLALIGVAEGILDKQHPDQARR